MIPICECCWKSEHDLERLAKWDRSYINKLSDEAFAVVEPAYKRGDTKNKNCRHLPHHKAGVKRGLDSKDNIDISHLRNALARMGQIKPVTDSISTERLRKLAAEHLNKHAKDLEIGSKKKKEEKSQSNSLSMSTALSEDNRLVLPEGLSLKDDGSMSARLVSSIGEIDSSGLKPIKALLQENGQLTIEDLRPREEDYLRIPVRALSKVIVTCYIDFSEGDVLKDSTALLNGVTIFRDHYQQVEEWLGSVTESSWSESPSPAGVDAMLQIDAFANLRITRGLLNEPPALNRVSVNIRFDWEKSHSDMDHWAFISSLGKKVDGEIVRFIATKINGYGEISLVWMGADPNAKRK